MTVKMEWYGDEVTAKVQAAAVSGVFEAAEYLLEEASRVVPLDEGTLLRSGEATTESGHAITSDKGNVVVVAQPSAQDRPLANVSYDTPYAARLHEHPNYRFQHGREGKWLERTFQRYGRRAWDYVQKRIADALKG